MKYRGAIKKATAIIMMLAFILPVLSLSAVADGEVYVEITAKNGGLTNVYDLADNPAFMIKLVNETATDYTAKLVVEVADNDGNVVDTMTEENIDFSGSKRIVKSYRPQVNECECYTITATLTGGFGTETDTEGFSRSTVSTTGSDKLGVCTHINKSGSDEKAEESAEMTVRGGFGWVRDDLHWGHTEPSVKGTYVYYSELKEMVEAYANTDTKLILVLHYTTHLYRIGGGMVYGDEAITAYGNFCKYVANLFKNNPNVVYELGNEPDNENFSLWDELDGAYGECSDNFAKLLISGSNAIKSVDEDATIISGGLCSMGGETPAYFEDLLAYEGAFDKIDGFSFHPYAYWYNGIYADEKAPSGNMGFLQQIEYVRGKLDAAGHTDMPIWLTEYGTPSIENYGTTDYNEREQAADLIKATAIVNSRDDVAAMMIYNLREKIENEYSNEAKFGIVDGGYRAKPAYVALSYINDMTADATCTEEYHLETADYVWSYGGIKLERENKGENEEIFMLWEKNSKTAVATISNSLASGAEATLSESGNNVTINIPADKRVICYDMLGNEVEISSSVELTTEPVYFVVADKDGLVISEDGKKLIVRGKTDEPNEAVTAFVQSKGEMANGILAIGQTTADKYGRYTMELNTNGVSGKYCLVHICEGEEGRDEYIGNAKYRFDTQLFINGEESCDVWKIKKNDKIRIEGKVHDLENNNKALSVYSAGYGANDTLESVEITTVDGFSNGEATLEVNATMNDSIKFLVWDGNGSPVAGMSVID